MSTLDRIFSASRSRRVGRRHAAFLAACGAFCIGAFASAGISGGFTFYYGGTGDPPLKPNPNGFCVPISWVKSTGCPYIVEMVSQNCQRTVFCDASECPERGCSEVFAISFQPGNTPFGVDYPMIALSPAIDASGIFFVSPVTFSSFHIYSLVNGDELSAEPGVEAGAISRFPASGFALDEPYAILGKLADGRLSGFSAFRRSSDSALADIPCEAQWTNGFGDAPLVQFFAFTGPNDGVLIRQTVDYTVEAQGITHNAFSCAGDFNADGLVDDVDFVQFVPAYNQLLCDEPATPETCPADLTGDTYVDDADFGIFVQAYNALICQ